MKQQDIEAFLQGQFELDCPKIDLVPCVSSSNKAPLSGSGYITLNEKGFFDLKVYISETLSINEVFEQLSWESGKIISDEAYYDLIAQDLYGNTWKANRFIPEKSTGPGGSMIIGRFPELRQSEDFSTSAKKESVRLHFNEVIKIPLNTLTKEAETVGDETRRLRTSLRLARFSSCNLDFEIEESEGHTTLFAQSDSVEITDILINRVFEAFCFVTAHSESWSILETRKNGGIDTRIRAVAKNKVKSRIYPPISYQRVDGSGSVWLLFDHYLQHIIQNTNDYTHPLSKLIYSVIESGKASLDVEALTLSVAIETLLKESMGRFYPVTPELLKNIDEAKSVVSSSTTLDADFKNRLLGTISGMKTARAKDILFSLRDKSLVSRELVKTYGSLRNKSAHGAKTSGADIQNYYNQISAVLVLFFQLIFLIVRYQAEYTDYSTYGYPIKQFNATLP